MAAKVYFTDLNLKSGQSRLSKLRDLILAAGIDQIDFSHSIAAIKVHFGEAGNTTYIRPNYSKVVADIIKELGGLPFVTDCNTLYPGRRKNALEHLELAAEHGFTPASTGCQIIIGDGLKGSDEALVDVPDGQYIKQAKIGHAIMDADIFISLSHFKGHIEAGFGGAFKNIGMGCGSRAGKMEMHQATEPKVRIETCIDCKRCANYCASNAISFVHKKAHIDSDTCVGCGHCVAACPTDSIYSSFDETGDLLNAKIVEYSKAVLSGRPSFHICLAVDVTPNCDCWSASEIPIVPDIGFFASFDPVALDQACADAVNRQQVNSGSALDQALQGHSHNAALHDMHTDNNDDAIDYFGAIHPHTNWQSLIDHAVKLKLGTPDYELITI